MSGIIRTWICGNSRCSNTFDSWDPNPCCPKCKCVRVSWCPAGGHIKSQYSKTAEVELRALADVFRMTDMHSAEAGRAAKKVNLPPPTPAGGPVHTFPGGFSAAINPAAGAQCVPTANKIDYKVKATPGNALGPGALNLPSMASNTQIHAAHKR